MDEEKIEAIADSLAQKYILISRTKFLSFLGGFFAFLVAAGFLTHQTVLKAISSTGAKSTLAEINQYRHEAELGAKSIDELLESLSKHPTSVLSAQLDSPSKTTSNKFQNIKPLSLTLPCGNAIRKFALVILNVPKPYAKGNNNPGVAFRITANGEEMGTGEFTYDSKKPEHFGRHPFTLIVRVELASSPTEVNAQWASVRDSECHIGGFASISAILG